MRVMLTLIVVLLMSGNALAQTQQYTCPMHPHYIAEEPGTCPICGMDLVKVVVRDHNAAPHAEHDHSAPEMDERSIVAISPETIQKTGVRTEKVQTSVFGNRVRSYGIVTPNARLQKKIYSRVEGWIAELGVSAVGDTVKEGDPIYAIHAPDLVLAQYDLLSFEKSGRDVNLSKLFLHYEVDKAFVEALRKTRKVKENVPYYSPYNGTVSELLVREGSYVTLNMPLMVLEDYSSVWINASVAEKDLRFLTQESVATVAFPNLSNGERSAKIDYIYPIIDASTRTGQVRLVLDNKDGTFKPGAYVDVTFETDSQQRLSVPSEAILKSSEGDFVIVALGDGRFQPRKVHAGIYNQGKTEILHGLKEGESVVVSSQFLIDSESSLRDAFRKMGNMTGGGHAGH